MGWLSSNGNSGFYRDFGSGGADFPRRKLPFSFSIDMTVHVAHRSPGLEWKVPIAVNAQDSTKGSMYGPMIQDTSTWEEFSWNSTTVEFGHGDPRNSGLTHKLQQSYRVVGVNGITGTSNSGNQFVAVGRPGWHQFLFRGARAEGAMTITDMTNLSIGYSRSVFTWADGASTTLQPMRIGTSFSNAAFYASELPDHVAYALTQGRHPLDLPAPHRPAEFYPLNDPGEVNEQKPRCVLTGNTLLVYGTMQWDDDATRATYGYAERTPPQTFRLPQWRKNNYRQIASIIQPASQAGARALKVTRGLTGSMTGSVVSPT